QDRHLAQRTLGGAPGRRRGRIGHFRVSRYLTMVSICCGVRLYGGPPKTGIPLRMAGSETEGSLPAIQMFIQSFGCCWPSCLRLSTVGPPWRPCRSGKVGGTPPRSGPWQALHPARLMSASAAPDPPPPPGDAEGAPAMGGLLPDRFDPT